VHRAGDGWRVLDYKTDQLEGDEAVLLERYGRQLAEYGFAWARVTGDPVASSGLVALRTMRMIWSA
jgi:ATP-dependent exoDNAse (exonuclease V) beta subunit